MPVVRVERVCELPAADDGCGSPVEQLWPRGAPGDVLLVDGWLHGVSPGETFRCWLRREPAARDRFQ